MRRVEGGGGRGRGLGVGGLGREGVGDSGIGGRKGLSGVLTAVGFRGLDEWWEAMLDRLSRPNEI